MSEIIPPKVSGIRQKVHFLIQEKKYMPTGHARKRLDLREVTISEVRAVLISGKRVAKNDQFHKLDVNGNFVNRWSYAFEKQGLDRKLRVCVAIDESKEKSLLIITVVILK